MNYMNLHRPLYPPNSCGCDHRDDREKCGRRDGCGRDSWRMPLFDCGGGDCGCGAKTVRLENPCRPGECAEVTLSIDSCGNLVICVHRDNHTHGCCMKKRC